MVQKVNLVDKFSRVIDHWSPAIVGELNGQHVKLAKVKGDFVWHSHENEDEMFWVQKGTLYVELRDKTLELKEGEMCIMPKGVEHRPYTKNDEEVWIMLFEPVSTVNTGNARGDMTKTNLPKI